MGNLILELLERHYSINGKDRATSVGMAIDAAVKELAQLHGASIPERFCPYDFELDGRKFEIKSTLGSWLSIPCSEIELAEQELANGRDVTYLIFQQLDLRSAAYLGSAEYHRFKHKVEPSNFLTWRLNEAGWKQEQSFRARFSEVKHLLTSVLPWQLSNQQ